MIDKLVEYAKLQQTINKIIIRLDIQFNYKKTSYSCVAWYSDGSELEITISESVGLEWRK